MLSNANARPGDVLILTKPIGTGVIGTATKFGRASQTSIEGAVASMVRLNRQAAEILRATPAGQVHACTDVTGFGLIGHASHIAAAGQVSLEVNAAQVLILEGALALLPGNRSGGLLTNVEHFSQFVEVSGEVDPDRLALLYRSPNLGRAHAGRRSRRSRPAAGRTDGGGGEGRKDWPGAGPGSGQNRRQMIRISAGPIGGDHRPRLSNSRVKWYKLMFCLTGR